MKKRIPAVLLVLLLCAALPLSVLANVSDAYYSNGNVHVTGRGNPGDSFIVGVYDTAGEVVAIGNADVDTYGNYNVTIIAGIEQSGSGATYEVRAYSQDNPNAAPAAGDVGSFYVPRSGEEDYYYNGSRRDNTSSPTDPPANSNNNQGNSVSSSSNYYDGGYGNSSDGYVFSDVGQFIGNDYAMASNAEASGGASTFGRVPQTGVFDITWAITGMLVFSAASVSMWVYILRRKKQEE